jgi:16S rRNA (adenine1518-N6/adenine1519-N6)-dimethyltransferase
LGSGGVTSARLLGPADVRALASRHGIRPTKQRGQNFVIDANTVRRIVAAADLRADDTVLEVGPGLGSLTLGLLPDAARVMAVELDAALAAALPATVAEFAPALAERLTVVEADALLLRAGDPRLPVPPTALVANLPYNVAVPVLLELLAAFESIQRVLVMVQLEVADRLAAGPGSRVYGVPSVKAAWFGDVRRVGLVGRTVFWPAPNVDSGLVSIVRRPPPATAVSRVDVFAVVDAAFAQRRKTLRAALAGLAGSATGAEAALRAAGVDPGLRGERLGLVEFVRVAEALAAAP